MDWKNKFPQENRYFETDNGILYCGDCLKILKQFPDNYIDLVLTDPPYNITDEKKLTKANCKILSTKNAWGNEFCDYWDSLDDYIKWVVDIYSEIINKISDIGSLISFFDRNLTGLFIYYFKVKYKIIFRNKIYFLKKNHLPHFRKNNYSSCIEEAIWFSKSDKYIFNFISHESMKQVFSGIIGNKNTRHPTEKYLWMIEPIIIRHTRENDLVLDCFSGSGTTLSICEELNRKWIGIELKEEYCEMTKKRLLMGDELFKQNKDLFQNKKISLF